MNINYGFEELTCRGLMLLQRLGNGAPSLSQMEFAQKIISLVCDDNSENAQKLDELFSSSTQSRDDLIRDTKHFQKMAKNSHQSKCGE